MITFLKVHNLAIVDEFSIELSPGLNILTGETGAGKSLLIDSLDFLSGARGSTDLIRGGEDRMSAEAIIQLPSSSEQAFRDAGIEPDLADSSFEIIVRRELSDTGRGRVTIHGSLVPVRDLQRLLDGVIEIHGQNQSILRIAGKGFREILDSWGENEELIEATRETWISWKAEANRLSELETSEKDRALRLDLLEYQIREISSAHLAPDEEQTLRSDRAILSHAEELAEITEESFVRLSDDEDSAIAQVGRTSIRLAGLLGKVAEIEPIHSEIEDIRFRLQEVARQISELSDSISHDPERLGEIEDRLAVIERIRRKYPGTASEVLDYLDTITQERDNLADYEASLEKARKSLDAASSRYRSAADELSKRRRESAPRFEQAIRENLNDLAMKGTEVRIAIDTQSDSGSGFEIDGRSVRFGPEGYDRIDILIAPNPGEDPKPIQKIASGGELSRIQLAIASSLFATSGAAVQATLVFDEIDAGIGGRVAEVVGRKLLDLSERSQVICVTHLPQIASLADRQFRVWKEENEGRTRARIRVLDSSDERVEEIARMLAGETVTDSARVHARDLLARAKPAVRAGKGRQTRAVS